MISCSASTCTCHPPSSPIPRLYVSVPFPAAIVFAPLNTPVPTHSVNPIASPAASPSAEKVILSLSAECLAWMKDSAILMKSSMRMYWRELADWKSKGKRVGRRGRVIAYCGCAGVGVKPHHRLLFQPGSVTTLGCALG
jgi:hypothetical protein